MAYIDNTTYIPSILDSSKTARPQDTNPSGASYKYDIKNYSYPEDLFGKDNTGNSPYGGNYVIFYINVQKDSKLLKNPEVKTVEDFTPRERGIAAGGAYKDTKIFASIIGGSVVGSALGSIGGSGVGSAVGVSTIIGAGGIALEAGTFSKEQKRLKTAIGLHMPNQLNIRYGANYSDEDTAAFNAISKIGEETAKVLGNVAGAISTGTKSTLENSGLKQEGSTLKSIAAAVGYTSTFGGDALSAATATQANPKKEQIFKGVDFRTFSMDYQFFPRSSSEAKNILNIIHEFKYHMMPEFKDQDNFLFLYPSEFDITYYVNGIENSNIHKHPSCVLTSMNINYTPNGSFNTFPDGMPTQINVTLEFKELSIITKESIDKGY